MQYGTLTEEEQSAFLGYVSDTVRKPTFSVWIAGVSDISDYVISIETGVALRGELPFDVGFINIGYGLIQASNEDETFYTTGGANIAKNAEIKIWAGFEGLNIPLFTGIVRDLRPIPGTNNVELVCYDNMSLLESHGVEGSQGSNNTLKKIIENLCSSVGVTSSLDSTAELTETLSSPYFEPKRGIRALEECCNGIFSTAFFDEDGVLHVKEWEYANHTDWVFNEDNVLREGCRILGDSDPVNRVWIEYEEGSLAFYEDQSSIDTYGPHIRRLRALILNSETIASHTAGSTDEELDNDLEGFKFTASATAALIDTVEVWMRASGATGDIVLKIYSDSGGSPDVLLGTSEAVDAAGLYTAHARERFSFSTPISVSASTDYWGILDTSDVTGTIYLRIAATTATAVHAYYDSGWNTENDKNAMYNVRQSLAAQRAAEDTVGFCKDPKSRLRLYCPAVPHLQLCDQVLVDIRQPFEIYGRYVITGRRHIIHVPRSEEEVKDMGKDTWQGYITVDTLEKRG